MTDSDPSDYAKDRIKATHSMGPNTCEDLHCVPIKALQELIEEWRDTTDDDMPRYKRSYECADQLQEVIEQYE